MKPITGAFSRRIPLTLFFSFLILLGASQAFGAHTIAGIVYDKARNPLPDIDVELQDEFYRGVYGQRQKTSGSGRFEFQVTNEGRYYIKVYAFRYDLVDELREIIVQGVTAVPGENSSSYLSEEFYLEPKKGGLADAEMAVIFAQDVPKDAKKLYNTALDQFSKKKKTEGIMSLVDAVKIYPDYYLALNRLTKELFGLGKFVESFQYARRVVAVNPKAATAYYYMGASLKLLGKEYLKAAIPALTEAANLAPGSSQVLLVLGKAERENGDYINAEKHLLAAKKLSPVKNAEIQAELSQLYGNDLKKYDRAADELEEYVKASKMSDAEKKTLHDKVADLRSKAKTQTNN